MRLTPDVIRNAVVYLNPAGEREANFRNLKIPMIENLVVTDDIYDCIDLSDNDIVKLDNFPRLQRLQSLLLSNNRISKIEKNLQTKLPNLKTLVLTNNSIQSVNDLLPLKDIPSITHLFLCNNPLENEVLSYRVLVAALLPKLRFLDDNFITEIERKAANVVAYKLSQGEPFDSLKQQFVVKTTPVITKTLSEAEQLRLMEMLEAAETMEEMEKIENILVSGVLPSDFTLN